MLRCFLSGGTRADCLVFVVISLLLLQYVSRFIFSRCMPCQLSEGSRTLIWSPVFELSFEYGLIFGGEWFRPMHHRPPSEFLRPNTGSEPRQAPSIANQMMVQVSGNRPSKISLNFRVEHRLGGKSTALHWQAPASSRIANSVDKSKRLKDAISIIVQACGFGSFLATQLGRNMA